MKNTKRLSKVFNVRLSSTLLLALLLVLPLGAQELPELGYRMTELSKPIAAPDFFLPDMDEEKHSIKDYRGKVVLLNFWATWCPPCRREMPSMEHLYQQEKDNNFVVFAINQWETPDHVFAYVGQLNTDPTFPIVFDRDSKVSADYGVRGLPTTYLIDKKGYIRYRAVGGREFDHPEVIKLIKKLNAE